MIKIALSADSAPQMSRIGKGSLHQYVSCTYVKAVLDAGAAPVIIRQPTAAKLFLP